MAAPRQVSIAVVGAGGVGKAFLTQLEALSHRFLSNPKAPIHLSLIYVSRSKKSVISEAHQPIPFAEWESALDNSKPPPLPLPELAAYLSSASGPSILVDNTSSQDVAESYPLFLQQGISVVTPNKKAFSSDMGLWQGIFDNAANGNGDPKKNGYVFNESTVGAGLPVISTLKELMETGDIVTKIEGVFSGTMSYLFNTFMPVGGGGDVFSSVVKTAKDLGYTEPDPRDDLNGLDVARKLTILARLAGLEVASPTSFSVQSLIPKELESVSSGDEFMSRLQEFDNRIEQVKKEAASEGKVLRYVGSIDMHNKQLEVGLQKFDTSHPIAGLKGSINAISFHSHRYGSNPLIVQGSGAGADVTAMGVTGDVIKVCNFLQ